MSLSQEITPVMQSPSSPSLSTSTAPLSTSTPLSPAPASTSTTPASVPSSAPASTAVAAAAAATTSNGLYQSYHSQIENLKRLPIPYSDIYHALSAHETIPLRNLHERFCSAAANLTTWLETAEMAVFALEMDVGQEGATDKGDVGQMDVIMNRFQPNIEMLVELQEKIESRVKAASSVELQDISPQQIEQNLQQTTQNIKASWASLKQMLEKVKGDLAGARLRAELMTHMDNVLTDIEDICTSIDGYNNERSAMTSDEEGFLPSKVGHSHADAQAKQRSLDTLAQVDSRIEILIARIDFLDNRVGSLPTEDANQANESKDALQSRYQQVLCRWDDLKFRRERVSEELKEDKWLEVFEQVAEQVESMMESMERAIQHCQGLLDQIKGMVRQKVVPDAPIDREHLYSIFKSFEAKQKYYAPAVNKMLDMLESGIESRTSRNMDVVSRHQSMNLKWDQLQDGLERVDMELDDVERLLDILDDSRTPYLPKLPLKKVETPAPAVKRTIPAANNKAATNNKAGGWKSPAAPTTTMQQRQQQAQQQKLQQQKLQQQQQQQANQAQRGRRPPPSSSLRSPSPSPGRSRTRSPMGNYTQRPWSPANSNSGLSQSGLLSPNGLNNYRSLSPSPSRSPSRCPSVSVTSPGIPGIPQSLSAAATYIPRPVSSIGQNYGESPAPANGSRSAAGTPSMIKAPNLFKPVFSPAGSISKLSTGIHSTLSSPAPPTTTGARKTGLPLPSSRPPSQQRSTMSPSPQLQRPQSRGYGRDAASPVPNNYASSTTSSNRLSTSSVSSLNAGRQRQFSSNTNNQAYHGYGAQEGRASPATAHLTSRQTQHSYYDDRAYSRPGSASGSTSSLGRDPYHHYQSYEEPTSPSASSNSSITSASRFHQQHYGRDQNELGERLDKMKIHIEDAKPYVATRGDELDEEFARVLNANPIQMQVHRLGEGKYYFGGRIEDQNLVGGKLYLCRLMEYGRSGEEDSGVSSGGSHSGTDDGLHPSSGRSRSQAGRHNPSGLATIYSAGSLAGLQAEENTRRDNKKRPRKVLVRVGGGWQDLDIFLLDHSSLANDNVVVRSY
ncbi:MAG: hypothetical protein J3R72DRAFT_106930 [Linnemannia gamsii]|nr:MAG: hypothetical protein J3R72DRAFT_106930 [Linnemannia gamsii]